MMATFLGLHFFFGVKPHIWMDTGILLMFYALYYGVVARDVAEYCTEKMVVQIGVSTVRPNKFGICLLASLENCCSFDLCTQQSYKTFWPGLFLKSF